MTRRKTQWIAQSSGLVRHLGLTALSLVGACTASIEYVVNTTSDFPDAAPGDQVCAGRGDLCSLRAAIEETNAHAPGDAVLIVVPAGTYDLNSALALTHNNVFVSGDHRDTTIIRQTQSGERVLAISTPLDIRIARVTLRDGSLGTGGNGGAVRIDGDGDYSVSFFQSRLTGNRAGFWGGGVYAEGTEGTIWFIESLVDNNDSTQGSGCSAGGGQSGGGGIMMNGPKLLLQRTEVSDNCGAQGGGVRIDGSQNHSIRQSTIAGNGAAGRAGGLFIHGGAQGRIEDSTIAENNGPVAGGILISGGQFEIESVTIAGNTSIGTSDGPTGAGGILSADDANVSLKNTVIASNNGVPFDCEGSFAPAGGNFVGDHDADCDIDAEATDVLDGGSPGLGPLLGGSMRPNADSPLVNAGVPGCDPFDQLSNAAPVGAACDIGAVERQ
jgi:CSLREA domain-containing protein